MKECLITNEVCPSTNKKCKECALDSCKEVLNIIEEQERYDDIKKIKKIRETLSDKCKKCTLLNFTNFYQGKVYCPYMKENECIDVVG